MLQILLLHASFPQAEIVRRLPYQKRKLPEKRCELIHRSFDRFGHRKNDLINHFVMLPTHFAVQNRCLIRLTTLKISFLFILSENLFITHFYQQYKYNKAKSLCLM